MDVMNVLKFLVVEKETFNIKKISDQFQFKSYISKH